MSQPPAAPFDYKGATRAALASRKQRAVLMLDDARAQLRAARTPRERELLESRVGVFARVVAEVGEEVERRSAALTAALEAELAAALEAELAAPAPTSAKPASTAGKTPAPSDRKPAGVAGKATSKRQLEVVVPSLPLDDPRRRSLVPALPCKGGGFGLNKPKCDHCIKRGAPCHRRDPAFVPSCAKCTAARVGCSLHSTGAAAKGGRKGKGGRGRLAPAKREDDGDVEMEEEEEEEEDDDGASSPETTSSPEDAAAAARAFAPQLAALADAINGVSRQLAALAGCGIKREPDDIDDAEREERRKRRREGTPVAGPSNDPDRADHTPSPPAGDAEAAGALDVELNGPRALLDEAAVLAELELEPASKEEEPEVDPTDPKGKKVAK